jgi:prepilin-type N-terminal cleavage/methylation domain-containing protein
MSPASLTPIIQRRHAFSLIELLAVMAILATLSAVTIPAVQSLRGAGSVNRAISDLSGTLEMARAHAMANRTYVRVLLASLPASGARVTASTLALVVSPSDGTTRNSDMSDPSAWPTLSRPLVLENLGLSGSLQGAGSFSTAADATPAGSNVTGSLMPAFQRGVSSFGQVTFDQVIQFGPSGEARVGFDQPARHISVGLAQNDASGQPTREDNAFILRLSGVNGSIAILRDDKIAR